MYRQGKIKRSIKTKVVLLETSLIAFILILVFGFILYQNISHYQEKADLQLQTKVEQLTYGIEQRLTYLQENTESLAKNELLINAFIDDKEKDKYLLSLIDSYKNGKYLDSVSLVDFDGRVVFQTNVMVKEISHMQELRLALNLAKTMIYFDITQNEIVFVVPIKYYSTTQGAIIARYNLVNIIEKHTQFGSEYYVKSFYNLSEFYSQNYREQNDYYTYRLSNQTNYKLLKYLNIFLEIGINDEVYNESLHQLIYFLMFIGLILLCFGGLVSYYFASTITKPILVLFDKTNDFSNININKSYKPLGTNDELEVLGFRYFTKEKELYQLNQNLQVRIDIAVKALKKDEQLRQNILANIHDLVWLKDLNGVYLICNTIFEQLYDVPVLEIVGKTDYDFVDKERADYYSERDKKVMTAESTLMNEEWITFASNNERVLLETTKEKITDSDGNLIGILGVGHDVTQRYNLQKALEEEKNRFALAIEGSKDGLWDWNLQTNDVFLGDRFETMLGYEQGDLPRNVKALLGLFHPNDQEEARERVRKYLESKGAETYESTFRLRAKDGSWRWILGRGKAQFDENGEGVRFVGFNTDISEQKEYQNQLDHTAKHDSLTHLPNRFLLSELLTQEMHRVKRDNKHLALVFIDLDGFKEVNDSYGHDAGDFVLSTVASRMKKIVRESDIVSRLGGDEFVVVLNNLDEKTDSYPTLERLLNDIAAHITYGDHNLVISASMGVSFYPQFDDIGNEALLRQADKAMYDAKLSGKNKFQIFNLEATIELREQQQILSSMYQAVDKDEFTLYYQPKVDIKANKVIGFEALLRWEHPTDGLQYPDYFLPIINHNSEFIIVLGKWVLDHAFSQLSSWYAGGFDTTISINVSSYEVQQESFVSYLTSLFQKYPNINPNSIEIELLETTAFENIELTSQVLNACKDLGVTIAIDDFGTGYASLHYLKKLPIDTLKIDKSFVVDTLYTPTSLSIIEASIGLAHAFNFKIIAEGVESEAHGKLLASLGCDIAQGYAIAEAMPASNVMDWVESYRGFPSWKRIEPINEPERLVLYASVEHRCWTNNINEFIQQKTTTLPQLDEKRCFLGKWLQSNLSNEHRDKPKIKKLIQLHNDLHHYVTELLLLELKDQQKGIIKLYDMEEEIIEMLASISTSMRTAEQTMINTERLT